MQNDNPAPGQQRRLLEDRFSIKMPDLLPVVLTFTFDANDLRVKGLLDLPQNVGLIKNASEWAQSRSGLVNYDLPEPVQFWPSEPKPINMSEGLIPTFQGGHPGPPLTPSDIELIQVSLDFSSTDDTYDFLHKCSQVTQIPSMRVIQGKRFLPMLFTSQSGGTLLGESTFQVEHNGEPVFITEKNNRFIERFYDDSMLGSGQMVLLGRRPYPIGHLVPYFHDYSVGQMGIKDITIYKRSLNKGMYFPIVSARGEALIQIASKLLPGQYIRSFKSNMEQLLEDLKDDILVPQDVDLLSDSYAHNRELRFFSVYENLGEMMKYVEENSKISAEDKATFRDALFNLREKLRELLEGVTYISGMNDIRDEYLRGIERHIRDVEFAIQQDEGRAFKHGLFDYQQTKKINFRLKNDPSDFVKSSELKRTEVGFKNMFKYLDDQQKLNQQAALVETITVPGLGQMGLEGATEIQNPGACAYDPGAPGCAMMGGYKDRKRKTMKRNRKHSKRYNSKHRKKIKRAYVNTVKRKS